MWQLPEDVCSRRRGDKAEWDQLPPQAPRVWLGSLLCSRMKHSARPDVRAPLSER